MAIHFITDSASDVLPCEAEKWGVTVLPMKILFGTTEYADCINLTHAQFYEKLVASDVMPTTCQIPPAEFIEAFEAATENGDEVIVLPISSKLSGTYQSACIAAADFDRVHVMDTETVCIGQRLLLQYGLRMAYEGKSAAEIVSELDRVKSKIRILALLDTLEYLKKGGRISAATALAGSLLSIKPVVTVEEGEVRMIGKARGSKQGNNLLRQLVEKAGGFDYSMPSILAYSGLDDSALRKFIAESPELWEGHDGPLPICTVGCTIGTHVGPGAVAMAFFEK